VKGRQPKEREECGGRIPMWVGFWGKNGWFVLKRGRAGGEGDIRNGQRSKFRIEKRGRGKKAGGAGSAGSSLRDTGKWGGGDP